MGDKIWVEVDLLKADRVAAGTRYHRQNSYREDRPIKVCGSPAWHNIGSYPFLVVCMSAASNISVESAVPLRPIKSRNTVTNKQNNFKGPRDRRNARPRRAGDRDSWT